jgi:hypothetical protein
VTSLRGGGHRTDKKVTVQLEKGESGVRCNCEI